MLTEERQRYILSQLNQQAVVKSKNLMQALNASESTIRRDLADLEAAGQLRRIHGGAERVGDLVEASVQEKSGQYLREKQAIAQAAAAMVQPHATIFLDAGTTAAQLIPLLVAKHVTVVTDGVDNASQLADFNIQAYMLSGRIKSATKAAVGAETALGLRNYHFDLAFLGVNGISIKYGLTTPDAEEAKVKQLAIEQSQQTVILADPSKFDQVAFARFAKIQSGIILTTPLLPAQRAYQNYQNIQEVSL